MLVVIWAVVLLVAFMLYFQQQFYRFSSYGVKHFTAYPFFGTMLQVMLKREHTAENAKRLCETFPKDRFVGKYESINPVLLIKDLELVKKITVKDFEYFVDHRPLASGNKEPFFTRNLLALTGQEWKDMRSTLSPAFTSSKMKGMIPFIVEVSDQMMGTLKKKIEKSGVDYIDIEAKDLTTRYANDVIATCAFGIKINSHAEEDNTFYKMGKLLITFNFSRLIKIFLFTSFPKIMNFLKVDLLGKNNTNFFYKILLDTMKEREQKNIIRPDMIHLLMEAKKGQLSHDNSENDADAGFATVKESTIGKKNINRVWSDIDLVTQAVLFFAAGFETVSTTMSFALYELAVNPDVQERLVQEIKENEVNNGGKFDYKSIQEMKYMDMVVSEVLRLWPSVPQLDRICVKDYNMGKPNDEATEDYIIRKGENIHVPVFSFHRNPEFFPNPDKFDPERFSEQNKHDIKPFAYVPFGVGPRNCIGSRFALSEAKVMLYEFLKHMEVSPCEKTLIPAQLARDTLQMRIQGGHWVRCKTRN